MYMQKNKSKSVGFAGGSKRNLSVTDFVQKKSNGGKGLRLLDNRPETLLQRYEQNSRDHSTLSSINIKGTIQRVLRDNWPDSINVNGYSFTGNDGGDSGIYYELPSESRATDRHISIHKAGDNKMDWFKGPGFSVKVHQTRNKYVVVYFLGGSYLTIDYGAAQKEGSENAAQEAIQIGESFYRGISGSTKEVF